MKSFINCCVLCCLVILVGCSGDSPKQPTTPTVTNTDVWAITSLDASDSNPIVGTPISVAATVTLNGSAAPDGTSVEFTSNGGAFANGQTLATVLTSGGQATVSFLSVDPGVFAIQARVRTVTSQIAVTYRRPDQSGNLQMWSINPSSGSYAGGESVILTGKGIRNPVAVSFIVQGIEYQAIVDSVVESAPLNSAGTITIRTPEPTAANSSVTSQADVKVTVGVGTSSEESQSYPSVFTYISDSVIIGDPVVFGVEPYYGRSSGGELVTILGLNFAHEETKALVQNFKDVYFNYQGQRLLATVERWSATQIEVITPRFSLTPIQNDVNAGIILTRPDGSAEVVKNDVFIVQADIAQPEITGISPTAGPLDGGTVVTISGSGFELPIQVHFGDLEATDVQVFDDQTPSDNDIITCRAPDYSQQGQVPPIFVTVRVTNLQTGNTDTSTQTFRYGDLLYVGQANPTEGQIGDLLTLYGAGFEDPLTVFFLGSGDEFDVISVTGTELTLRSPPELTPTCNDRTGPFRVILNESNLSGDGGQYTLLGGNPTVTSVDPIFVNEIDAGANVDPNEIDIYGVRFAENVIVRINNYTVPPEYVDRISGEQIHISRIPTPEEFFLQFDTTSCTTDTGLLGVKEVPTPVDVTVRNLPLECEDTLRSTLVYVPEDESCQVAPNMSINLGQFEVVAAGSCSLPQTLTITNNGEGTLDISSLFLQGRFYFDAGAANQNAGPLTVPPFSFDDSLSIYFCPDQPTGGVFNGQLTITSNNPGSPNSYSLSGTEGTPPEIGTSPYVDGDPWPFPATTVGSCSPVDNLTISNTGVSVLSLGGIASSDPQFNIVANPQNTNLDPATDTTLSIEFCPSGAGAQTSTVTIFHNGVNANNPITLNLSGNGI